MFSPSWEALPELRVRCDLVVASKGIDEAIETFAAVILKDSRAMQGTPLNAWVEVRVTARSSGSVTTSAHMTAMDVEANTSKFFATVRKAVLSAHVRSFIWAIWSLQALNRPGRCGNQHELEHSLASAQYWTSI
jgi:hypothetical protein